MRLIVFASVLVIFTACNKTDLEPVDIRDAYVGTYNGSSNVTIDNSPTGWEVGTLTIEKVDGTSDKIRLKHFWWEWEVRLDENGQIGALNYYGNGVITEFSISPHTVHANLYMTVGSMVGIRHVFDGTK